MANKFWVGGTGSASDTTHWATTSGGAGSTGIPATGDNVTFDAASGGGTVTCDFVTGLSLNNVTAGAFTGTLDFTGTNPNMTITGAMNLSGTGARKFLLGSGTFTFTSTAGTSFFDLGTTTNLDGTSNLAANFTLTGNSTSNRTFAGGGRTYGALTISANTSRGQAAITGANTFSSMAVAAGVFLSLPGTLTTTITNAVTWTGTSSNPVYVVDSAPNSGVATISIGIGTSTLDWAAFYGITATGGGTFNATNSLDLGRNTGWSITAPSGGGGTVPYVIG